MHKKYLKYTQEISNQRHAPIRPCRCAPPGSVAHVCRPAARPLAEEVDSLEDWPQETDLVCGTVSAMSMCLEEWSSWREWALATRFGRDDALVFVAPCGTAGIRANPRPGFHYHQGNQKQ